jgi:hypothetical protein
MRDSISPGKGARAVRKQLRELFAQCRQPGWDGYNAEPVLAQTYQNADSVLSVLPTDLPVPTVGIEADGHLTLEW